MYRSIAVAVATTAFMLVCVAAPVLAQGEGDAAAYAALSLTPTAGLPPVARPWMAGQPQSFGFDARWGILHDVDADMNTFVAGVSFPISRGLGDFTLSGGYLKAGCEECTGAFVAGIAAEQELLHRRVPGASTQFGIGVNGSFGFGKPDGGTLWSAMAGTPFHLALGAPGHTQVVPFVTPSIGWGLAAPDHGDSESGVRFVLGGGVGVVNIAAGVTVNAGVSKTFITGGKMIFGGGLSYVVQR